MRRRMAYFIETVLADIFEVDELHNHLTPRDSYHIWEYINWINKNHLYKLSAGNYYVSYHGVHICKVTDIRQIWEEE